MLMTAERSHDQLRDGLDKLAGQRVPRQGRLAFPGCLMAATGRGGEERRGVVLVYLGK